MATFFIINYSLIRCENLQIVNYINYDFMIKFSIKVFFLFFTLMIIISKND